MNSPNEIPPRIFLRFFRWYCHPRLRNYVEGDLLELYRERITSSGKRTADIKFIVDVILLFRPAIIRSLGRPGILNQIGMFKSYVKIASRSLVKQRLFTAINMIGLAVGMAGFLLIIHYVRFERSYEGFQKNADDIFRVTTNLYKGSEFVVTDCETYPPLGPMAKATMPEVVEYVRFMNQGNEEVKVGDRKFYEEFVYFADPSVFDVFSYPILYGDRKKALTDPHQVALTVSMAKKYFGRPDATGASIEIGGTSYKVTAILADLPPNTHLKFDFLMSHSTIPTFWKGYSDEAWDVGNNEYTYLLMRPGTSLPDFNKKLDQFSVSMQAKMGTDRFAAERIKDIHLYSNKTFEPETNGNAKTVYFLLIIAIFIIILAWVNYVNLSTARAMERGREVGIRKVMGSFRSQLVLQFLAESAVVNLLAAILTAGIVYLGLPLFRELSGQPLPGGIFLDPVFWYLFLGLLTTGILLSGFYPALVLSSFDPAVVLKGKFKSSSHGQWMRKSLVVFQFGATMALIVCLGTIYLQINHLRKVNLGMSIDQILTLRAPDLGVSDSAYQLKFQTLKTELLRDPMVQSVTQSTSLPGLKLHELGTTNSIFRVGQEKKEGSDNYYHYQIDADFLAVFKMTLAAGRNFESEKINEDQVLINEEAAKKLGFANSESAIGEKITFRTRWKGPSSTVIGVIKNFNQRSPKEKPIPMVFRYSAWPRYFSLRMNEGESQKAIESIRKIWSHVYPDSPYVYFFIDENYNGQYKADLQFGKVIGIFSILAVMIACLGLFGLSSYTILQRTREIGIRKVMGGSVAQIVALLSRDFIRLVLGAGILVMPAAYLLMREWLSGYATRIELNAWLFIVPLVAILAISMLTVSFQTFKAAQSNPVNSLRSE